MRFKFCGDGDTPDWILASIARLSDITSVRTKLLTMQTIAALCGDAPVDAAKVDKFTAKFNFTDADKRQTLAALAWIVTSAARHACPWKTLADELQQVGFPKEHAESVSRSYRDSYDKLSASLDSQIIQMGTIFSDDESGPGKRAAVAVDDGSAVLLRLQGALVENSATSLSASSLQPLDVVMSRKQAETLRDELRLALAAMNALP